MNTSSRERRQTSPSRKSGFFLDKSTDATRQLTRFDIFGPSPNCCCPKQHGSLFCSHLNAYSDYVVATREAFRAIS
jgi:hypothetical protein